MGSRGSSHLATDTGVMGRRSAGLNNVCDLVLRIGVVSGMSQLDNFDWLTTTRGVDFRGWSLAFEDFGLGMPKSQLAVDSPGKGLTSRRSEAGGSTVVTSAPAFGD